MIFFLDIAIALEVIALIGGAILLIFAEKESSNKGLFLKLIAYFAMIVAIGGMLCTVYYGLKYRKDGYFKAPHPMMSHEMTMKCPMMDMKSGNMMQGKMMMDMMSGKKGMGTTKPLQDTDENAADQKEHQEHHSK